MKDRTYPGAIDTHAHLGDVHGFPQGTLEKQFCSLSLAQLSDHYRRAGIAAAMASPAEALFPIPGTGLLEANLYMEELVAKEDWLYQWAVVSPLIPASYYQAETMLKNKKCVGVKLHPEAHRYAIKDYGDELFAFCSSQDTILQIHSGEANSMPEDMVPFADRFPGVTVICAHLGCGSDGDPSHQVRAIQASRHGNLLTDVSSARSILFHLLEWAVSQVGAEKLLFGTDTPLHHIGMMMARVTEADITQEEKEQILYGNALRLFPQLL